MTTLRKLVLVILAITLALVAAAAVTGSSASLTAARRVAATATTTADTKLGPARSAMASASFYASWLAEANALMIANWYAEERAANERAAQEAERVAAEIAARPKPVPVSSPGAHSDAWWRAVAVCEQGGRNHPFFGYFSIMDGSAGGLDWATQVGMANGIIARAGDRAWAASCVSAGYNASPGG